MKTIQVFDPPLCCSTGTCGPNIDPVLVRFAADLKWIAEQGITVQRFNLTQSPAAFVENEVVRTTLNAKGEAALPLILIEGKVAVTGRYPTCDELASLLELGCDNTETSCCSSENKCCCDDADDNDETSAKTSSGCC
jgi:hypothetical protein